MNQITLRKIPDNVYDQLRMMARKNKTSINRTIIRILKKSTGLEDEQDKVRDLSELSGTWDKEEFEEFRKNISGFATIDEEVWK